ncbi:MAG: proline/glycine betaine ABC transporter permease [Myxococcales bacterium]|nr:proline/glycine betaine ABC transporter permease [Myxococcales bacterium]
MTPPPLPVGALIEATVAWLLAHGQGLFSVVALVIGGLYGVFAVALSAVPASVVVVAFCGLALWRSGWQLACTVSISFSLVVGMGLWTDLVATLALLLTATLLSLTLGLPLGIWCARSNRVDRLVRPLLDLMQTMPAFVYLIPAVMFFGLGRVPGVVATVVFATPPAVRLTNLGIRQVPRELVEAGLAFGCTDLQLLFKVQVPSALPSILAGVNQNIMLSLSMVVIASMIGAGGLGDGVLRGIQRLDVGLGFESGIAVVLLAVVLDRLTESFGRRRQAESQPETR